MIEIELKARLSNKNEVEQKLVKMGCTWSAICVQNDTIYKNNDNDGVTNSLIFRIRECGIQKILTLKAFAEDTNVAEEFELYISDCEKMEQILQILGFFPKETVKKQRKITAYKGFNICIDEVDQLGSFIEIEKMAESDNDKKNVCQEIEKMLHDLNIPQKEIVKKKYYEMITDLKIKESLKGVDDI